jgi:S1-C subfamily serine protease
MIIKILTGNKKINKYKLKSNKTRIGRGSNNDITINDKKVSRDHLILIAEKNTIKIKDLASTNGTYINGKRIRPEISYEIKTADSIRIGDNIINISQDEQVNSKKSKLLIPLATSLSLIVIIAIILLFFFKIPQNNTSETINIKTETVEEIDKAEVNNAETVSEETTLDIVVNNSPDLISIIEDVLPSVVDVSVLSNDGEECFGSGIIYDNEGYIITNYHLIQNYKIIDVATYKEETINAKLINYRRDIDIALLKILKNNLEVPVFGRSSDLKVGQDVIAIGSPYGLSSTVTKGIVSSFRDVEFENIKMSNAIQHDAEINPGNSGGPLINSDGEVIGINFFIISPDYSSTGLNFAIPIDLVLSEVTTLKETELAEEYVEEVPDKTYDERYIYLDQIYKILGEYEKAINHMNYYYENTEFSSLDELIEFERTFLSKLGEINRDLQNINVPQRYKDAHLHMISLANSMYSYIEQKIKYLEEDSINAADSMIEKFNNTYSELVNYYNNL